MRKITVILTQAIENNTSSMIRCKSVISAFPELGYQVDCYCPYPTVNGIYKQRNVEIKNVHIKRFGGENPINYANINVSKPKGIKGTIFHIAYKIFKKFDLFGASLKLLKYKKSLCNEIKEEKPDILISFSDPMTAHMIGKYIKQRMNVKYIQQWGDPLTTDTIGKIAQPRWIRYFIEKSLIKNADKICYVSPLTKIEQQKLFGKYANRMVFIPTPCVNYGNSDITSTKSNRIRIGYYGSYNTCARNLLPFYNAACRFTDFEFFIIGDSDLKLEEKENVKIVNRIPETELKRYIDDSDVLVCLMNIKGNQIPGKLYHDAGTNKELLLIKDGEYGDEIVKYFSKFDRYSFVENDEEKIIEKFKDYAANGVPRREPLKEFMPNTVAKELLDF